MEILRKQQFTESCTMGRKRNFQGIAREQFDRQDRRIEAPVQLQFFQGK
jgi:hypothetical protein